MCVFADVVRTLLRRVGTPLEPVDGGVHGRVEVGAVPVVHGIRRPRRVARLDSVAHRLEVRPRPRLVAVAPEHNAGVVLVALQHVHAAPDHGAPEPLVARSLPVAMRLHVRLVHKADAAQHAEIVPVVVLRIVRVAHYVAVCALEHGNVLPVALARHVVSVHRVRLVAVRAVQLDLLSVELVASVNNLARPEAPQGGYRFAGNRKDKLVAVWRLRTPEAGRV